METSSYSYENQPPRKNSKGLIIGLLAAGLIIGIGFAFINNSNHDSVQQTQQTQIARVSDDRDQLQRNFDNTLVRLDSMTGLSNRMQAMLSGREKDIAKMKMQIRSILKNQHLTE